MTRGLLTISTFISVIFFPWPFSALLAIGTSLMEPLVPLAAGIFADTLYYSSHTAKFPVFALYGLAATLLAFFVRSRLSASIIGE